MSNPEPESKMDDVFCGLPGDAFDRLPSDLDAIVHVLESDSPRLSVISVPGIKTELPFTDADMVEADITYLKHRCSGQEFLRLIAIYTNKLCPSFEEMILAGRCELFLEHADMEYGILLDGDIDRTPISTAWAMHHRHRVQMREDADRRLANLHNNIREEEAKGMYRCCRARSEEWRLVKTISTMYPEQMKHAAQICINESIDPTALGSPGVVMDLLEATAQHEFWEGLIGLYREKGLGLWPNIDRAFKIQAAEQAHFRYPAECDV